MFRNKDATARLPPGEVVRTTTWHPKAATAVRPAIERWLASVEIRFEKSGIA